jgi:hypothetical protein
VPMVALTAVSFFSSSDGGSTMKLYFHLFSTCGLMSLYLTGLDEAIRTELFNPVLDLKNLVDEINPEDRTPISWCDVVMQVLLFDVSLVRECWKEAHFNLDKEGDELRRNDDISQKLGKLLLSMAGVNEAPLEEDVFRLSVLESLGGNRKPLPLEWINFRFPTKQRRAPLCIPLARALCGFVGGLGEAILQCSSTRWELPLGLLACGNYAVTATGRLMVHNLKSTNDWKSAQLAVLVPTSLKSFFRLRKALMEYGSSKVITHQINSKSLNQLGVNSPLLMQLIRTCDTEATEILRSLSQPQELADLSLDLECLAWTESLIPVERTVGLLH